MPVTNNTYVIPTLQGNTTFYDWYVKENNEIIAKLNLLQVYSATGGDGILASTNTSGLLSLSIGGTSGVVQSGLTFNGAVSFKGLVNLPNVSYKITGLTSGTSGISFGMPVRITSTGYTAGKANSQAAAETIGIISNLDASGVYVTVLGKVDGDFTPVNAGATLSAGCFYFLSPSVTGGITTTEPTTTGQVSKPILLGLGATSGMVLPYRGHYLDSSASGVSGATGLNRIYALIPTASATQFTVGRAISYNPKLSEAIPLDTDSNRNYVSGWFLSKSTNSSSIPGLSYEDDFVVGLIVGTSTDGLGNTLLEIATNGDVARSSTVGVYYIQNDFDADADATNLVSEQPGYGGKIFGIQYAADRFTVVNNPKKASGFLGAAALATSSSGSGQGENLVVNGDFAIWQRPSTGRDSQYTSTGSLVFADMWRRHDGVSGGSATKSYYIQRQAFADIQSDVEGNPEYYLDIKALGLSGGTGATYGFGKDYLTVGHVIPNAKSLDSQIITFSFYAKCSYSNYSLTSYISRYNGASLIDYNEIEEHGLDTTWTKYVVQYTVPTLPNPGSALADDYFEIGFNFKPLINEANINSVALGTNLYASIASVCVYLGSQTLPYDTHKSLQERLNICRKYYYSTYALDQTQGSTTMINTEEPTYNTEHHMVLPNGLCRFLQWPFELRTTPTVTIYSPSTGTTNDAYNRSSNRDLRNSSGTIGYGSQNRVARLGVDTLLKDATKYGLKLCVSGGAVDYDNIFYHIVADADYPI
jgi:hypothetical protein